METCLASSHSARAPPPRRAMRRATISPRCQWQWRETGQVVCCHARRGVAASCARGPDGASATRDDEPQQQGTSSASAVKVVERASPQPGVTQEGRHVARANLAPPPPPLLERLMPILGRVMYRTLLYVARRLSWGSLKLNVLATNILFVLGVILVNYGVESALDHYLGEDPFGSLACIMVGMGVMLWIKLYRVPLARKLIQTFWN